MPRDITLEMLEHINLSIVDNELSRLYTWLIALADNDGRILKDDQHLAMLAQKAACLRLGLNETLRELIQKYGDELFVVDKRWITVKHLVPKFELKLADEPVVDEDEGAKEVFEYWQRAMMPGAKLTVDRLRRIKARMKEGFTAEQLKKAIDAATRDDFLMGWSPQSRKGGYRDVKTVLRDAAQVERLIASDANYEPAKVMPKTQVATLQVKQRSVDTSFLDKFDVNNVL